MFRHRILIALFLIALLPAGADAAAKKPATKAVPAHTIAGRLKKIGLRPTEQKFGKGKNAGVNLYAEIGMTAKPSRPGTKKPKRMNNWWYVNVVKRIEPASAKADVDADVANALTLAKEMKALPVRKGGQIYVFIDPNVEDIDVAVEEFAKLVANTKRTVSAVNCVGMGADQYDCRDRFAKWGMPAMIGYQPE